jgi:hypothetical protein
VPHQAEANACFLFQIKIQHIAINKLSGKGQLPDRYLSKQINKIFQIAANRYIDRAVVIFTNFINPIFLNPILQIGSIQLCFYTPTDGVTA